MRLPRKKRERAVGREAHFEIARQLRDTVTALWQARCMTPRPSSKPMSPTAWSPHHIDNTTRVRFVPVGAGNGWDTDADAHQHDIITMIAALFEIVQRFAVEQCDAAVADLNAVLVGFNSVLRVRLQVELIREHLDLKTGAWKQVSLKQSAVD